MSLSPDLILIERALDALERREVQVLVWGLVDGALSEAEVEETLRSVLNKGGAVTSDIHCSIDNPRTFRQRLIDGGHIMLVPGLPTAPPRYRTRMAEGVRLFARLRQLFSPKHDGRDGWIGGATLVADYRLLWRPRRYPERNLSPTEAATRIEEEIGNAGLLEAVRIWLAQGDTAWKMARFQVDASIRILQGLDAPSRRGTLVAAGTGSGKTLAFYLPALSWLAAEKRAKPESCGVRILALYPRNELLKDQLAEVFGQSRKFDEYLGKVGATLSVGVLYGDTPHSVATANGKWQKNRGACPFFHCPDCNGELHLQTDKSAELDARLFCRACGGAVDGGQLRFTRKAMQESPPDILFTTVEMMNQRMSDSDMRHLFGLGPGAERVPTLMLLDEVHLYTGTYGAQVAHLLRRWSHQTRRKTQFVGLSATLSEGKAFFASLVDLDPSVVEEISPLADDMSSEGAEYMLALRGDPVSQSALLSTSIQTLMLASRLLDRRQDFDREERPFAGWRTFAFTDQVDATNRLFYDLRDAEGLTAQGHPATGRHPHGGLAHMRQPGPSLRRYEGGQDWRLSERIGHDLTTRHRVERTTAYDTGVSHDAEIVVATAALEVGYDDPAVGVVLQHKAPRDMAQFVQRKGRAGRTRHMRPWTLMVLSDYGRDRLAYQAYEQFFDPQLPPRDLPLSNRYIRRMQATYALIDHLGIGMQVGHPGGSVWRDLSGPNGGFFKHWRQGATADAKALAKERAFPMGEKEWQQLRARALHGAPRAGNGYPSWDGANWLQSQLRRQHLVQVLGDLLKEPAKTEAFAHYLSRALSLAREDVDTLLWDHPRPLLLDTIPTTLRRLVTDWRAHGAPQTDRASNHPLPEFIPATLFSDLALPEVRLLRRDGRGDAPTLPVLQALSELAPGKVSLRLDQALWLGPEEAALIQMLDAVAEGADPVWDVDIADWYATESQPPFQRLEAAGTSSCDAYRPLDLLLTPPPSVAANFRPEVQNKSNARLVWRSQLFGHRAGARFPSPVERVGIARLVREVLVHTHASQSAATVRRYAVASKVDLRIRRGAGLRSEYKATWRFTRDGRQCGVGFEIDADALCFALRLPASPSDELMASVPEAGRAARSARFRWEAQYGAALADASDNVFLRDWLAQVFQVAAIDLAVVRQCTLAEAIDMLATPAEAGRLSGVLETIFQSPEAPDDADEQAVQASEPRLRKALSDALGDPDTVQALKSLAAQVLTGPIDGSWDAWLRQAMIQTLAAAIIDAIQQACPQVDPDELVVDIDPGPLENGSLRDEPQLWISEANPGGNGLVEQVVEALASNPDHFYRRVEAALAASEFEQIDLQLRDFVQHIGSLVPDDEWVEATRAVRDAASSQQAADALSVLRHMLANRGHAVFHGYVSALSSRLLRPQTPPDLDSLLADLLRDWDSLESRLGIEVDARVMCAVFSSEAGIDTAFASAGFDLPASNREAWRFSMLLGTLWARGHTLRANALPASLRFADLPATSERLLLTRWLTPPDTPIAGTDAGVLALLHDRLVLRGRAVVALSPDADLLNRVLGAVVTTPVQLEYLNVYPRLTSVVRLQGEIHLHLELEATV